MRKKARPTDGEITGVVVLLLLAGGLLWGSISKEQRWLKGYWAEITGPKDGR